MRHFHQTLLTLGLAAGTTLFLAGCKDGGHAGHDHGNHAHAAKDAAAGAVAMVIVEKPTAEQLNGTKEYPLKTCLVSEEELGSMGDPVLLLVGDQQVKLCCNHCLPDVKKDTAKLMAKLKQ